MEKFGFEPKRIPLTKNKIECTDLRGFQESWLVGYRYETDERGVEQRRRLEFCTPTSKPWCSLNRDRS